MFVSMNHGNQEEKITQTKLDARSTVFEVRRRFTSRENSEKPNFTLSLLPN